MPLKQHKWLIVFILVVITIISSFSYLLLKEPEYAGPSLEEKFNQEVIVACVGSEARQELGNLISTKEKLPKLCVEKCQLHGFAYGIQYNPQIANGTLCLCIGKSSTC